MNVILHCAKCGTATVQVRLCARTAHEVLACAKCGYHNLKITIRTMLDASRRNALWSFAVCLILLLLVAFQASTTGFNEVNIAVVFAVTFMTSIYINRFNAVAARVSAWSRELLLVRSAEIEAYSRKEPDAT